ncbi:hypothetical protein PR202_gb08976 [Eleusine coracana subsp. coracana]|uniref:Uncharacterized protein n=1 Tax=Eleusine coracana subsp. coracana TaxID=191504 RepID=A0AAV5EGE6_ELECO|nr:hypothetical protein PR202_gb08976 [Eleusine coracana subsp. coracana]
MAKYNVVQKNRREWNQNRKRQAHGEPGTGKLKQRNAPLSMSGKRKRKLQRRQNREQKEATVLKALENNMGDVDMVSAEGTIRDRFLVFNLDGGKLGFPYLQLGCYQENLV